MSSETVVQQGTRLEHCRIAGAVNWRNNTGVMTDERGIPVRYGLANESAKQNAEIKSSDLIGITPTLITPQMVGFYLGVFTALECKPSDWTFPRSTNRAEYARASAQLKYHDIVRAACGYAGFVTDPMDVYRITNRCP